jgi:hypothetical protein
MAAEESRDVSAPIRLSEVTGLPPVLETATRYAQSQRPVQEPDESALSFWLRLTQWSSRYNGNRYQAQVNQQGDGAAGIGTVTRAKANPQFVLAPGASRDATFTVSRYKRDSKIGSTFTFDLTIAPLEMLAGEQIRVLREYAVGFTALTAGGGSFLEKLLQPPPR